MPISRKIATGSVLVFLLALQCAPSSAATFSTSGASEAGLGDQIGSGFDILTLQSTSGTFTGPATITLNTVDFTAGINAVAPATYSNLFITEALAFNNGIQQQLTLPFSVSINYTDMLSIAGGTFSFLDGDSTWQLVVNPLILGPNPGGTMSGYLTAQVSEVPLPAALPLFASGLGGMSLLSWWRKKRKLNIGAAAAR